MRNRKNASKTDKQKNKQTKKSNEKIERQRDDPAWPGQARHAGSVRGLVPL